MQEPHEATASLADGDIADYVQGLLAGSGAEHSLNIAELRRRFAEDSSVATSASASSILLPANTTTATNIAAPLPTAQQASDLPPESGFTLSALPRRPSTRTTGSRVHASLPAIPQEGDPNDAAASSAANAAVNTAENTKLAASTSRNSNTNVNTSALSGRNLTSAFDGSNSRGRVSAASAALGGSFISSPELDRSFGGISGGGGDGDGAHTQHRTSDSRPDFGPGLEQQQSLLGRVSEPTAAALASARQDAALGRESRASTHNLRRSGSQMQPLHQPASTELVLLEDVSSHLVSLGLPALHASLLVSSTGSTHVPGALTKKQAEELRKIVTGLSAEITRNKQDADKIVHQLSHVEAGRPDAHTHTHNDALISDLDRAREAAAAAERKFEQTSQELALIRTQINAAHAQTNSAAQKAAEDAREIGRLRFQLDESARQLENARQRDIKTLSDFKRKLGGRHHLLADPASSSTMSSTESSVLAQQPSGLDAIVLEVIRAYEAKIEAVKREHQEQLQNQSRLDRIAMEKAEAQLQEAELTRLSIASSRHSQHANKPNTSAINEAASERINELEKQLDQTMRALDASRNELELAKLKLMDKSKVAAWKDAENAPVSKPSTRDLIRRDKRSWKRRLAQIDSLSGDEVREVLRDICTKLSIRKIENLSSGIQKIHLVLGLVGQMERFIREVDAIVRAHSAGADEDATDDGRDEDLSVPRKLPHTLAVLRRWGGMISDASDLRRLSKSVHRLLGIHRRQGSDAHCIEELRRLVDQVGSGEAGGVGIGRDMTRMYADVPIDAAHQAVRHFQDLFEVRTPAGVIPKMNDLFVFWAEATAGLRRIRSVLGIDAGVLPGRALVVAAECLEKTANMQRNMYEVIESSRSVVLDGSGTPGGLDGVPMTTPKMQTASQLPNGDAFGSATVGVTGSVNTSPAVAASGNIIGGGMIGDKDQNKPETTMDVSKAATTPGRDGRPPRMLTGLEMLLGTSTAGASVSGDESALMDAS